MPRTIEELETKICAACKKEKSKSQYHKRAGKKSGVQSKCKECMSAYKKVRYWSNRDQELAKMTKSRLKPQNLLQRRGYYEKNKKSYRERYENYKKQNGYIDKKASLEKKRYRDNLEAIRTKHRQYSQTEQAKEAKKIRHKIRKEGDPIYNIKRRLRFRLRHLVKSKKM